MNLLARITRALLFALNPHQQTYTTIIYPARGQAVVIRDDLNIRHERPWYQAGEAYQAFSSEPIHDLWYRESSQSWELLDGAITADGLDTDTTMSASTDISGGQHMQFNPANGLPADSTPFGHSAHADPDTCSTIIRTGSRSAATQGWHC